MPAFDELQQRMAPVHAAMRGGGPGRSIVVVPSRTIDKWHEPPAETQAYEERLLCLLLSLRDPGLRVVYVTSSPVAPAIVDYYLGLLPGRLRTSARARLTLLSAGDGSARPLAEKLLERPQLLARIRRAVPVAGLSYLVPYTTTALERDLALALDLPLYGADPRHARFGTKSGCRELFAQAGVPHPVGVEHVRDMAAAIERLRAVKPDLAEVVVKLDEGVSGEGNAVVDVRSGRIAVEAPGVSVLAYLTKLAERGGIVEERITGTEVRSPSVQLQLTPAGEVDVVSTHDQVLGGRSGQSYLGCRFPAEPAYAPAITEQARRIGQRLVAAGVIGRCAVDFVVVRDDREWRPYAIEINLRKGGTTHPFAALQHLTGGRYDAASARFTCVGGAEKHYVATDHLESPALTGLGRDGALALGRDDLAFERLRGRGVVLHMMSSLDHLGRVGLTAIGDSAAEAQRRYEDATAALLEAAAAGRPAAVAPAG
ncbi:MAG TPA: peptide ligase PGM1-related protein [Solirubrobacteraceae bacterium]|nr:peptide ligase PGM1-related protein [Solirubrobacteraceae bacterium]